MKTLVYPHHSIVNEVETIFINGIKFEVCEFISSSHSEFNIDPRNRFFLLIDDCYYNHEDLLNLNKLDSSLTWRRYCKDKKFLIDIIKGFEQMMDSVDRLKEKYNSVKGNGFNPFKSKLDTMVSHLKDKGVQYS